MTEISITFKCGKCGHKLGWPDDAVDSTQLTCTNCGEDAGTYGDLHKQGMDATRAKVRAILKKALKGS